MENNLSIIMSEVSRYLEGYDDRAICRIPRGVLNFIEENRDPSYVCDFDYRLSLSELDLPEETKEFICMIVLKYWCDTEEDKKQILNHITKDPEEQKRILEQLSILDEMKQEGMALGEDRYLLMEQRGKYYPHEYLEARLYGYENRYAMMVRRVYGGLEAGCTIDARRGKYEVTPVGILLAKSEMNPGCIIAITSVRDMVEGLTPEEWETFKSRLQESGIAFQINDKKHVIHSVAPKQIKVIGRVLRSLEVKKIRKVIKLSDYLAYAKSASFESYDFEAYAAYVESRDKLAADSQKEKDQS